MSEDNEDESGFRWFMDQIGVTPELFKDQVMHLVT